LARGWDFEEVQVYIRTGLPPLEQAPTTTVQIPTTPSVSSSSRHLDSIVYTPKVEAGIVIHDSEAAIPRQPQGRLFLHRPKLEKIPKLALVVRSSSPSPCQHGCASMPPRLIVATPTTRRSQRGSPPPSSSPKRPSCRPPFGPPTSGRRRIGGL
jgi:hypothetical protein